MMTVDRVVVSRILFVMVVKLLKRFHDRVNKKNIIANVGFRKPLVLDDS